MGIWLKNVLFAFGLNVRRHSALNRAIDVIVSRTKSAFFVQIRANNGVDFDDLYFGLPGTT